MAQKLSMCVFKKGKKVNCEKGKEKSQGIIRTYEKFSTKKKKQ
jgi:hypothetical protein